MHLQQFDDLKVKLMAIEDERETQKQQIEELKEQLREKEKNMESLEHIIKAQQEQVLQYKGNMRVFVRPKPVNLGSVIKIPKLHDLVSLELDCPRNGVKTYHFDKVFLPESSQASLFKEIEIFIQAGINGENVCIFAYGQTGAGKTYTMEGPTD
jgi:kinesin family member C1